MQGAVWTFFVICYVLPAVFVFADYVFAWFYVLSKEKRLLGQNFEAYCVFEINE
jgi:hypothetical protein